MKMLTRTVLVVILPVVAACVSTPEQTDPAFFAQPSPVVNPVVSENGSLYQAGREMRLFEDLRARRTGDILTVILMENTDASKSATTNTSKQNDVDIVNPTLLGVPVDLGGSRAANLGIGMNSSQEFSGSGASTQSNSLQGSVTVVVADVLPNGNLVIQGEKRIGLNQGEEFVKLSGIVRPQDVSPDNSVYSTQIANAKIHYGGKGAISSANMLGWLAKFFLSFSPF